MVRKDYELEPMICPRRGPRTATRPPGGLIKVQCPEGVRLLDQTKPGPDRLFTRLCFRSDRGLRNSGLGLAMPDGRQLTVPAARTARPGASRRCWRAGKKARLECNSIIFRSRLDGLSEDKTTLATELAPPIEVSRGFKAGYYDGALVTDESQHVRYRVARVAEGEIVLDRPCRLADFADIDHDGRRMVFVIDHGERDEAVLMNNVFLRMENDRPRLQGETQVPGPGPR